LSLQSGPVVASLIPATAQKQPIQSLMRLSSGRADEREREREKKIESKKRQSQKEGRFITKVSLTLLAFGEMNELWSFTETEKSLPVYVEIEE
jgi:hypothetical protein